MFFHYFRYSIKIILRSKESMFWTLLFPIALVTFMFASFGNIYDTTEKLNPVPVAIVQNEENEIFEEVVNTLSEGDDRLLEPVYVNEDEALESLANKDIEGIIYVDDKVHLTVKEEGYDETILSSFLDQYVQKEAAFKELAATNPEGMMQAMEVLDNEIHACNELSTSNGNQDNLINYFYAVFAMSCLFGAFNGADRIFRIQANLTTLGARRGVAPTHKSIVILAEFIAGHLVQFFVEIITFLYMWKVLGIDFGDKILPIIPILFLGSACGLALGMVIGALPKPSSQGAKVGITVSFTMTLSVMADLCASGIKDAIEHTVPIINRINPAALISNAFYALNVYDTYTKYLTNIALLGGITVLLCIISFLMIRRNRYASL